MFGLQQICRYSILPSYFIQLYLYSGHYNTTGQLLTQDLRLAQLDP